MCGLKRRRGERRKRRRTTTVVWCIAVCPSGLKTEKSVSAEVVGTHRGRRSKEDVKSRRTRNVRKATTESLPPCKTTVNAAKECRGRNVRTIAFPLARLLISTNSIPRPACASPARLVRCFDRSACLAAASMGAATVRHRSLAGVPSLTRERKVAERRGRNSRGETREEGRSTLGAGRTRQRHRPAQRTRHRPSSPSLGPRRLDRATSLCSLPLTRV